MVMPTPSFLGATFCCDDDDDDDDDDDVMCILVVHVCMNCVASGEWFDKVVNNGVYGESGVSLRCC